MSRAAGIVLALAAGLASSGIDVRFTSARDFALGRLSHLQPTGPAPNDIGPVIDTTPESKRARRRRLAKQGGQDHG
jgi:hypothetical protein